MSRRDGFTLIEVMVAVMIISVVVVALLQLQSNNTHSFIRLEQLQKNLQYILLLQGSEYGYENDTFTLERTVDHFDLDDDLRRELKGMKANVFYRTLKKINMEEFDDSFDEENVSNNEDSPFIIEIGRTTLQLPDDSVSVMRIRTP